MKKPIRAENRRRALISFTVLSLIAAFAFLPSLLQSAAGIADESARSVSATNQAAESFEFYDIRADKSAAETLLGFRRTAGRDAARNADVRDDFVSGEARLRRTVPTLKIEYNHELGVPGLIAPDVLRGAGFLTAPTTAKHAAVLRGFLKDHDQLFGLSERQISQLKTTADYTNPNGELSFVSFEQFVGDIPVFRSEIRAAFNKHGALFRVINNSAPALEYANLSNEFGDPSEAVTRAAGYINHTFKAGETTRDDGASTDLKAIFGNGDWATTAEKMYFPTEIGVARAAWRVLIWQPVDAYYVIVDAETGAMLYRENITAHQTQPATYNVYANTTSILKALANPAPFSAPGLLDPALQTQGALQPRTSVTLIGNEAPYTFNTIGWMTDGANGADGVTDGNNVEAGIDRQTPNGVDATIPGINRVFSFDYTPGSGIGTAGESPLLPAYQNGAATNLFYVTNRYHDETYLLGFTEQARNFQANNFARGGVGNDRISAEAQDNTVGGGCAAQPCVNNANFATPADGARGRMQMYIWNFPEPDRDGDLDTEIVVHELTHGLFARLHSGSVANLQAGQMNEGNSDFFAHVMLAEPTDPINGVYVTGGYSTLGLRPGINGGRANYYYGIRRFPKAVLAFRGGANNRPHNPLTFADIDPAKMNVTDGAYPPAFTGLATAVHDGGEIWSSLLWEVRARLVNRLGAEAGNKKILQLVMDGMKIAPSLPSMIQERNAIIQAAQANGNGADVADIWAGFAARGMGFSAANPTGNTVTEAFDLPNATLAASGFFFSDTVSGGDGDGYAEPGETIQLNVPVVNNTGNTVTNVVGSVNGGGNASYGTLINGQTLSRQISYTIPTNAVCGSLHTVTINISTDLGTQEAQTRTFRVGASAFSGTTQNFDGVTAPALPVGWTQTNSGANPGWVTDTASVVSQPNSVYARAPEFAGQAELITTAKITSSAAQLSFKNFYNMESTWDGTVLEIQIGDAPYQDITAAGGSFVSGGYNTAMNPISPFGARQAWSGSSTTFLNTVVNLPAAANNRIVNLRWFTASDTNTTPATNPGHRIDDVVLTGGSFLNGYECANTPTVPANRTRADFDGDGRTDLSVFRPNEGNWYLNRSAAGFTALNYGAANDRLVPGDYDGDGKTDLAVMRPNANNTAAFFYIFNSGTATSTAVQFGLPTDVPVVGDYDNDRKSDVAVFRPSNGTWYILQSTDGFTTLQFGQNGDVPAAHDYNGDGKTDAAFFRPSNGAWYIARASGNPAQNFDATQFGSAADKLVPADYDGDGRVDIAVFRPSSGIWYLLGSQTGLTAIQFGDLTDVPVPGDYDGDGKTDVAVYRGGNWFVNRTTAGYLSAPFGTNSDQPIPKQYIP